MPGYPVKCQCGEELPSMAAMYRHRTERGIGHSRYEVLAEQEFPKRRGKR
jgi:hypothetical protein